MHSRSIWSHMLWKEFRQLMPVVALLIVSTWMLQGLIAWFHVRSSQPSFPQLFFLATLAPLFAAIASTALSIGSERQTGTWNWNSSLPVSWKQALGSKFAAAIAAILLSAFFAYAFTWPFWDYAKNLASSSQASPVLFVFLSLLLALELWILSCLLCLVIREPIVAIGVSGLGLVAIYVGTYLAFMETVGPGNTTKAIGIVVSLTLAWVVAMSIGMVATFRWQWQRLEAMDIWGFASLTAWKHSQSHSQVVKKLAIASHPPSSTFLALSWQALRQSAILYSLALVVFLPIAILALVKQQPSSYSSNFIFVFAVIGPWLGIQMFAADRARNRYRFLADRGVGTISYYWSRTLPALVFLTGLSFLGELIVPIENFHFGTLTAFALACLVLGQLAGVCIRSSILGFCFTYLLLIGAFTIQSLTMLSLGNSWEIKNELQWYFDFAWIGLSAFSLIGIASIHWLIPHWFLEDRPRLEKWYPIVISTAVAMSLATFVSVAIYTVPTGKEVFTARQDPPIKALHGFQVTKEFLNEYNSLGLRFDLNHDLTVVDANGIEQRGKRPQLLHSVFERIEMAPFEQIEMAPAVSTVGDPFSFMLDIYDANLIARAVLDESVQKSDWGLANRAWTFQKKLAMIARDSSVPFIVDQKLAEQFWSLESEQLEALAGIRDWLSKEVPAASYEKFVLENSLHAEEDKSTQGIWVLGPLDGMRWVSLQREHRYFNHQFPVVESILERIENAKNMGELERIRSDLSKLDKSLLPVNRSALGAYFIYRSYLLQIRERLTLRPNETGGEQESTQLP